MHKEFKTDFRGESFIAFLDYIMYTNIRKNSLWNEFSVCLPPLLETGVYGVLCANIINKTLSGEI